MLNLESKPLEARTAMTRLIHLELQYLCTKMMQFVTVISHDMHVCSLSILRIFCFSYCIC